jgi:hypothetical protein
LRIVSQGLTGLGQMFKVRLGTGAVTHLSFFNVGGKVPTSSGRIIEVDGSFWFLLQDGPGYIGRFTKAGAFSTVANMSIADGAKPIDMVRISKTRIAGIARDGGGFGCGTAFLLDL